MKSRVACRWAAFVVAGTLATSVQVARAETQTINAERWQTAVDRHGIAKTNAGKLLGHLELDVGGWGNYERNPMVVRGEDPVFDFLKNIPGMDNPSAPFRKRLASSVNQRVASEVTFSLGLFNWVQLFGALPVGLFQDRGQGIASTGIKVSQLNQFNIGDVRLGGKVRILKAEQAFVDLAFVPQLTLPVGLGFSALSFSRVGPLNLIPIPRPDPGFGGFGQGYMTEAFPTLQPEFALSRDLWGFFGGANAGLRLRRPYEVANALMSQEFLLRGAVGFRGKGLARKIHWMKYAPVELGLEGSLAQPLPHPYVSLPYITPNGDTSAPAFRNPSPLKVGPPSAELTAIAGVDLFWFHPYVGAAVALSPGVGTPDWRVLGGLRMSTDFNDFVLKKPPEKKAPPPPPDRDRDGVQDAQDRCPDEPGPADNQGCPKPKDSDGDGLLDEVDSCPRQPEDFDGLQDADGCPETDADGDGVLDEPDVCPLDEEIKNNHRDADGCPDDGSDLAAARNALDDAQKDADGDGLVNGQDLCPQQPEDADGFEDGDGCPDADNDGDGFADAKDTCPLEPEVVNGNQDEDGCPDKGKSLVVLTKEKIEIREKVFFATGKATIQKRSFQLLDQVSTVINTHQEMVVSVEGHTDDQGNDDFNMKLSQDRADSVRNYLLSKGVAANRLTSVGYGETRPMADNKTAKGREQNRRVEFVVRMADEAPPAEGQAPANP